MLLANQERKRERAGAKKGSEASQQAHKERDTPPYCKGQAAVPLHKNSRQKISKKSPWVALKKFSEKFFGGMFRGKEKPLALSQRKGKLTNEKL